MSYAWTPDFGTALPDMKRCRASVSEHTRFPRYHQCHRKDVIDEEGMLWCKTHAPSTVKKKASIEEDAFRVRQELSSLRHAILVAESRVVDAAVNLVEDGGVATDRLDTAVKAYHKAKQKVEALA